MRRSLGNYFIAGLVLLNGGLWLFFGPRQGQSTNFPLQVVAEFFSSSGMILWAMALVLANKPRFLEPYFGGLDRMYVTHKNIAILAVFLLLLHLIIVPSSAKAGPGVWIGWVTFPSILVIVLLTVAPRLPLISQFARLNYDRWRNVHKYLGVFFIAGALHAWMAEPLILHAPLVFGYVSTLVVVGALAYLYKEFLWDRRLRRTPYQVEALRRLNGTVVEVALRPRTDRLVHRPGQFIFIHFDSDEILREPHPFTVSSSPAEEVLRLSIKASGDWTQHLHEHLQTGAIAYVDGPYGEFDYHQGGPKQIWIAGGIGITPFIAWIRDFEFHPPDREIDFFYTTTVPEEALFLDEIEQARRYAGFRAHVIHSLLHGRLSLERVVALSGEVKGKDVFLCGPSAMVEVFRLGLLQRGLQPKNIHYEEFNFR